jgi:hypothetical protein
MKNILSRSLGQGVFGHKTGFGPGLKLRNEIRTLSKECEFDNSAGSSPLLQDPKYVHSLSQFYDDELIETLQTKFDRALENGDAHWRSEHEGDVYSEDIRTAGNGSKQYFRENVPEITQLLSDELLQIIRDYYQSRFGTHFYPDFAVIRRNRHVPDRLVDSTELFSNYWHSDGKEIDVLKLFVNLTDVTEEHGPFHVISRSDTKKLYGFRYNREEDGVPDEKVERNANVIKATGESGHAMLANTCLNLHRAGNPAKGNHRDIIIIRFRAASKEFNSDWLEEYPLDGSNLY